MICAPSLISRLADETVMLPELPVAAGWELAKMPESPPVTLDPDKAASPATVTITVPPAPAPVLLAVICAPPVIDSEPHCTEMAPAAGPSLAIVAALAITMAPTGTVTLA